MNAEKYEGYYNISYFEGRREELQEIYEPVSYTHLDVYKRQDIMSWCGWFMLTHQLFI